MKMRLKHTKEYLPSIMSLVKTLPLWSVSSNEPPTFGRPTPLVASAILFLCIRPFSCSKYQTRAPQVATNIRPALHENGCAECQPRFVSTKARVFTYPCAMSALCLLDRLIFCSALRDGLSLNRRSRHSRSQGFRLKNAVGEASLALSSSDVSKDASEGPCCYEWLRHGE